MPNSYAQSTLLTCPACSTAFNFDLWQLVDTAERPDLLENILAGTLHRASCPTCGASVYAPSLLLVYRPGQSPRLVLSASENFNPPGYPEMISRLFHRMESILPPDEMKDWKVLPVSLLPGFLRGGPEGEQQILIRSLKDLVNARSWDWVRMVINDSPCLLEDAALALLERNIEESRRKQDADSELIFLKYLNLLRRCREVGVEAAIEECSHPGRPEFPPGFEKDLQAAMEAEENYQEGGDISALDAAACAWERILANPAFPAAPTAFQMEAFTNSGGIFMRRYWAAQDSGDLERGLMLWQQAGKLNPEGFSDLSQRFFEMGSAMRHSYAASRDPDTLGKAIQSFRLAVSLAPPDSPNLPAFHKGLGRALMDRFALTNDPADAREAAQYIRRRK